MIWPESLRLNKSPIVPPADAKEYDLFTVRFLPDHARAPVKPARRVRSDVCRSAIARPDKKRRPLMKLHEGTPLSCSQFRRA
jgi:hypothetical protein